MQIEQWGIAMTREHLVGAGLALILAIFLTVAVPACTHNEAEIKDTCIETHQALNRNESQVICGQLASI